MLWLTGRVDFRLSKTCWSKMAARKMMMIVTLLTTLTFGVLRRICQKIRDVKLKDLKLWPGGF